MLFGTKIDAGRVFGVPVRIDLSLLLVAGMFVLSYSRALPGRPGVSLVAGLLGAAALAAALLAHEVGHAIAAQAHGCRVHEITLMFFGGKATMSGLPSAPLRRAAISIAGPAAGLLLWLAAAGAATLAADAGLSWLSFTLAETARMSRFLSLFNMIPALPLDGGHVLRDVIAHFRGRALASYATARLSKWIAWAMGLYGLLGWDFLLVFLAFYVWRAACDELALAASGGDDPDGLDDDVVVISPPPFGKEREYTRIRRR